MIWTTPTTLLTYQPVVVCFCIVSNYSTICCVSYQIACFPFTIHYTDCRYVRFSPTILSFFHSISLCRSTFSFNTRQFIIIYVNPFRFWQCFLCATQSDGFAKIVWCTSFGCLLLLLLCCVIVANCLCVRVCVVRTKVVGINPHHY